MSLKNKELIEKNQYELTFEVERAKFNAAVDKVYRRQVKNISIPGFRRGKAPRAIIEKMKNTRLMIHPLEILTRPTSQSLYSQMSKKLKMRHNHL